ncbi:MAG: ribonuclease HII, partial [Clostridia bacterium]
EKIIDEINILQATKQSMIECVDKIAIKPEIVLVDAVKLNLPIASESIIKGDEKSYSIACASILAKVTRDRIMEKYDEIYPQYQFGKHKGYGTKIHIEAIKQFGACEIHRRTFIKKFI